MAGSRRDRSTSSIDRVPTGYGPVGEGMTSTGSTAAWRVLGVLPAEAVADATTTLTTTTPTATDSRRVARPASGASAEALRRRGMNSAAAAPIATIAAPT